MHKKIISDNMKQTSKDCYTNSEITDNCGLFMKKLPATKHRLAFRVPASIVKNGGLWILFALFSTTLMFTSCKQEWDEHYNAAPSIKSDLNLYEYIQSRTELSVFAQMLKITGYDSILSKSQTFTVWAPVNQSLSGIDLNNVQNVRKIVTNHIARFAHPTADVIRKSSKFILMNNKILDFSKNQNKFVFGEKDVIEPDIAVANGVVHILADFVPYRRNFWEFISEEEGLDSLRNFLVSLNTKTFDEEKSFVDGIFVDSIFKETNIVIDYLANLKSEDSVYTAILPDNEAWSVAYSKARSYFKTLPKYGGETTQNKNAKLTIVLDLFFRGRLETPINADTLISTNHTRFASPGRLFEGATLTKLSNGYAYKTSSLKSKNTETWLKALKVEAENLSYRTFANFSLSNMSSIGTGFNISRGYYLYCNPTTTSDLASINNMFVKFGIPSTYSGKYNIYCVTVPAIITNPTDLKPNKLRYFLSFMNATGALVSDQPVNANNEVVLTNASETQKITMANMFTTNPNKVDTMLVVKNYSFEYADIYSDGITPYIPAVSLRVNNASRTAEILNFSRILRLDCIILKPVEE